MESIFVPGQIITVKPSHRADLGGDPATGTIIDLPSPRKVKVLWANGRVGSHDLRSPYMWRYQPVAKI